MTSRTVWKSAAIAATAALCFGGTASGSGATAADVAIERIAAYASERGFDARAVLSSPQTVQTIRADGTVRSTTLPAEQAIRRVAGRLSLQDSSRERGIVGPFELNAGALVHVYVHIGQGAQKFYNLTQSAAGLVSQIKGSGWLLGGHSAGQTNIDTAESGPYLPTDPVTAVLDRSVDFAGNVEFVEQTLICVPFLGCIASFGMFAGEGVTLFDNSGPVSIPQLP